VKKLYRCDVCGEGKVKEEVKEFVVVLKEDTPSSGQCRRTYWVCKEGHEEVE